MQHASKCQKKFLSNEIVGSKKMHIKRVKIYLTNIIKKFWRESTKQTFHFLNNFLEYVASVLYCFCYCFVCRCDLPGLCEWSTNSNCGSIFWKFYKRIWFQLLWSCWSYHEVKSIRHCFFFLFNSINNTWNRKTSPLWSQCKCSEWIQ